MGNEISSRVKRGLKQGDDVISPSYPRGPYPEHIGVRGKQLPIKGQSLAQALERLRDGYSRIIVPCIQGEQGSVYI